ncbi:secretion protein HlyD [Burkholderiales bacterium GJ-E10]|nr:secretion protein HlyD [Burkholderiales bacterium GJ-E10]
MTAQDKKTSIALLAAICAVMLGAVGFGIYRLGFEHGMQRAPVAPIPPAGRDGQSATEGENATLRHMKLGLKAGDVDPANGRKILYYHDPMVPNAKFNAPGKSPFMNMMLVPVYAGTGAGDESQEIAVSPRMQQSIGIRTAEVREGRLTPQVVAEGNIAYNERDQIVIQARATGYIEHLYVRAALDPVRKGQALVDLYVPDWVAAQEEFLALRRMQNADVASLLEGARERMRQVGMTGEQIRLVESTNRAHPVMTLTAPIGGVVTELAAREGMTVTTGTTLFRINGLATVWADAEVPESQAALLRAGAKVRARSPAVPETTFDGRIQTILPQVNAATHTIKVRMELSNRGDRLAPGMFVTMQLYDLPAGRSLLVPSDAVIRTGNRAVVILARDDGFFHPVEVEPGIESGGQTQIRRGLQAGQRVVVSSQFLIDSEASLRGVEARMGGPPSTAAVAPKASHHRGKGRVEAISRDAVTLSHEAIASMHWGPMTMAFKIPPQGLPPAVVVGTRVRFEFFMGPDGLPQLTSIEPAVLPQTPRAGSAAPGPGSQP